MSLDLSGVRAAFPALRPTYGPSEWLFLDNAGGSHVLGTVVDRMHDYLLNANVQLGASYARSEEAGARVAAGRSGAARLFGASPGDVALGGSTTELFSRLARALEPRSDGAGWLRPGDELVVTNCDHEANIGPWRRLADRDVVVREWRVQPDSFALELDDLERLWTDRTRLVCCTHTSNILGRVQPLSEIIRFVHDRGAAVCVDGVAYAPHGPVAASALDVDFYAVSFYKVYGPHVAGLYVHPRHQSRLARLNHDFIGDAFPAKLEPGNVNYEQVSSLTAITDYLSSLGAEAPSAASGEPACELAAAYASIAAHEGALQAPLLTFLAERNGVRLIGPSSADRAIRVPTVSFVVDGVDSATVPAALDREHIAVRYGHFYAKRLIDDLGLAAQNGVVRVSLVHYNTQADVDRLITALDRVLP